jgi:hypothetical protein
MGFHEGTLLHRVLRQSGRSTQAGHAKARQIMSQNARALSAFSSRKLDVLCLNKARLSAS